MSRGRDALVEAILAGAAVGVIEALRVGWSARAGSLGSWLVIAAFAAVAAIAAAIAVRAAWALVERVGWIARWGRDLAAGGERRVVAAWRGGLAVAAVLVFGWVDFHAAAWAHDAFRFNDSGPVGLVLASIATPIGVAVVVAAIALDRRISPRLATAPWAMLDGRRAGIAGALAALAIVLLPVVIVHRAVPAVSLDGAVVGASTIAAVGLARGVRVGRRRAARLGAAAIVVLIGAGVAASVGAAEARRLVVEQGFASRAVARALWWLADRDADGYPSAALGGADCDDGDPLRNPGAIDVAGNGRDENCTGADADPATRRDRAAARPAPPPAPGPRSIVLISVDALRADHLGAWGYPRPTSPAIDRLAASATRFSWALTSSPSTRHAIPSLHTGRYASNIARAVPPPSLAEVLRAAGWDTAVVMSGQNIVAATELRGFATVDLTADARLLASAGQANSDVVADVATRWLATRSGAATPFLLWLHLYDPHHPYATPDGVPAFGDSDLDRYDAEIVFADRAIGRIVAAIDQAGLTGSTVVAITGDHGDEFNEHGIRFHARSLYNQVVRVPLIVRVPGARAAVVDAPVSLVDVMPTLLELVGQAGPAGMSGRSLAAAVRGTGPPPARPVLLELTPDRTIHRDLAAVVAGTWKAIWDREANAWSLYSLADPGDADDRASSEPAALEAMQRELRALLDAELGDP